MVRKCFFRLCQLSERNAGPSISFHRAPKDYYKLQAWKAAVEQDGEAFPSSGANIFVCSRHFRSCDFITINGRKNLRATATPSMHTGIVLQESIASTSAKQEGYMHPVSRAKQIKEKMEPLSDRCRLCLDPCAECFTTIDNPQLKDQMEKVFCFRIETKPGYCSGVCQSCRYAISEFYQYSEKVRKNQETLHGNVINCDPTMSSQIKLESVKVETLSDSRLLETTKYACEPRDEVPDSKFTLENIKLEVFSDSKFPEPVEDVCEPKDEVLEEDEIPILDTELTLENVKHEMLSDSDEVSGEDVPNFADEESFEPSPKKPQTKRLGDRKPVNLQADKNAKNSEQATLIKEQEMSEEDQLFNKHIRMICDVCGSSAASFTKLLIHFWTEHNQSAGYVVCCNKKLFKQSTIQEHIDYHVNPDVFRCEMCGHRYKEKATLARHMIFKHPSEDHHQHPFKCDQCPQSFTQKYTLTKHMKSHIRAKCSKCNKLFFKKSSLDFHVSNKICADRHVEFEKQRFQCEICHRLLKTERNLRNHMSTHRS